MIEEVYLHCRGEKIPTKKKKKEKKNKLQPEGETGKGDLECLEDLGQRET